MYIYIYISIGKALLKIPLPPTISVLPCQIEGPQFDTGVFLRCAICSHAGLAPGFPTRTQSERHPRCAFGEPACT